MGSVGMENAFQYQSHQENDLLGSPVYEFIREQKRLELSYL